MILAADVRNGGITVGLADAAGHWKAVVRLSAADRSADEWAFLIRSLFAEEGILFHRSGQLAGQTAFQVAGQRLRQTDTQGLPFAPSQLVAETTVYQAVLSSVVPAWTGTFVKVLEQFLPDVTGCLVVGPGIKTGLRIKTDNPAEVGSDLVCNAVAAAALVSMPAIVIDFSTTLSFTALDRQGDLVGVALAPGLEAAAADLRLRAAQIPQIKLEEPTRAIGKNTAESIRSGILYGWAGLVDRLIDEISRELAPTGELPALVGTGWYDTPPLHTRRSFD
ncbi:MAG: type III pantothenate kinase, partial [Termitinemataceae bacterium]